MSNRPIVTYDQTKLQPAQTVQGGFQESHRVAVRLPGGVNYPKGTVLGEAQVAERNEVQTLTFGGTVSGGSVILTFDGYAVVVPWNATAAQMTTLFTAAVGQDSVVVTGTGPFVFTFGGDYQKVNTPLIVVTNNLTGTSPTATMAETTSGSSGLTGSYAAYNDANADGTQVAKLLLERQTVTDAAGRMVNQFGPTDELTAPALSAGDYYCADLVGLDAAAVADLGKLIQGSAYTVPGAVLRIT